MPPLPVVPVDDVPVDDVPVDDVPVDDEVVPPEELPPLPDPLVPSSPVSSPPQAESGKRTATEARAHSEKARRTWKRAFMIGTIKRGCPGTVNAAIGRTHLESRRTASRTRS
jgi:hypothetical protein